MEMDGEDLGDKFLGCIVNFCQPSEWSRGPKLTEVSDLLRNSVKDGRVGITIGCHPHFADQMSEQRWEQFEVLISSPSRWFPWLRVVAVGECGLDYSEKNSVPRVIQVKVFVRQVKLALKYNMSIVLHVREAEQEALSILQHIGVPEDFPIHRHCYSGDLNNARSWLSNYSECKLGFTGLITYSHSTQVQRVVKWVPEDKFLLETDSPYMIPVGATRNRMNCSFPGHVVHVAAKIGELKGLSTDTILIKNNENSKKIYNKFFN